MLQPSPPHPAECPSGQVYGDCANACPRVCAHLHPGTQCLPETCQPGCACPLGQVLLGSPTPPCSPRGPHCHLGDPTAIHHPGTPLPPTEAGFPVTAECPTGSAGWGLCPPRVVPLPAVPHPARSPQPLAGAAAAGTRPGQPPPASLQHLVGAAVPGITPRRVTPCGWLSRGAGSSAGAGWALTPPSLCSVCIRGAFNCSQEDCDGERPPSLSLCRGPHTAATRSHPVPHSGLSVVPVVPLVPLLGDMRGGRAALPPAPALAAPLRGGRVPGPPHPPDSLQSPQLL